VSEGAIVTLVAATIAALGGVASAVIASLNGRSITQVRHQTNSTLSDLKQEVQDLKQQLAARK